MKAIIKVSLQTLVKIAERDPEYSVTDKQGYAITDIHYRRSATGRRDKRYVYFLCNGREELCPVETVISICD